ncbi:(2R)-3-sulfolactate dehydrogenase (NADP+) [Rhodobium orientis]|uniref:Sulfolactate dehydrogenase n=1 Tax=Rhodobium orientis TaxID=34017 RepID=A0A327JKC0_9HYPH|nr:Ldh family oxidoreductase [Rhodobium orientis]MBB4304728.1 (2R)-3-sulfolactate dehydrogenase (NADP+) [Rhodobium orientis]MBK5952068.1 sulfolactate dehydrogenase [Rhodobium orientis]RAI26531.1 sulfolactate dehydrogenase [Rhodobium orientis]
MADEHLTLDDVEKLATDALTGAGARPEAAASVARSTVKAERDGIRSHGLLYVPIYAEHVVCGKVDGRAEPVVSRQRAGAVTVDARSGFAHPAIDAGWQALLDAARENGIAAMTVFNSYNCGVLGHHAERIAEDGLIGLCFTHAPASIAPAGGKTPVIGTNPFAVGVPDTEGGAAIVIDQSASVVAKSEIMLRARTGEAIEAGWALDAGGNVTTDPAEALKGSMAPAGGYKGFGVGLMVELLAACLSGAVLSKDASPFSGTKGGPPNTGQCFIAIEPAGFSPAFSERVGALSAAITAQEGTRLPGGRRQANRARIVEEGVTADTELLNRIRGFCRPNYN